MRVSERQIKAARAKTELELMIHEKAEELGLTDVELLQALTSAQQTTLKYMLRVERHGDAEKPAGIE